MLFIFTVLLLIVEVFDFIRVQNYNIGNLDGNITLVFVDTLLNSALS